MDQEIQFFGADPCDPVICVTSPQSGVAPDQIIETPSGPFLGEQSSANQGRKTLVLDLDETLVHSTFQPTDDCSYVIPVEIEGDLYNVYVYLRPGAIEFLRRMSEIYEVVVYTASLPVVCASLFAHCVVRRSPARQNRPQQSHLRSALSRSLRLGWRHPGEGPGAAGAKPGLRGDDRQLRGELSVPAEKWNRMRAVH